MFYREKKLFLIIKSKIVETPQNRIFKRVNPCFWSESSNFFIFLFSLKIRLEIRYNNVLDRKETFFYYKNENF